MPKSGRPKHPDARIIERDLTADTLPFVTESWIQASYTPPAQRTPQQQQELALSDALIEELMAADVIVLGVPMHNFSIPASLKAWFDLVARAGKTFSYSDKGPKGLIASGQAGSGDCLSRRSVRRRVNVGFLRLPGSLLAAHAAIYRIGRCHRYRTPTSRHLERKWPSSPWINAVQKLSALAGRYASQLAA